MTLYIGDSLFGFGFLGRGGVSDSCIYKFKRKRRGKVLNII